MERHDENALIIYTDGSCKPNPRRGGFAFVILSEDENGEELLIERNPAGRRGATNIEMVRLSLVFPRSDGGPWTEHDYGNWRRRTFDPLTSATPYDLRHTFASLLIWEGQPITYVAQQLGHSPQTCLTTYAHVIDGVEANMRAETVIREARLELLAPDGSVHQEQEEERQGERRMRAGGIRRTPHSERL